MSIGDPKQVEILEVDDDGAPLPPPSESSAEVLEEKKRLPFNPWLALTWMAFAAALFCLVLSMRGVMLGYSSWSGSIVQSVHNSNPTPVLEPEWWMYLTSFLNNLLVAVAALGTLALAVHTWRAKTYRWVWLTLIWLLFLILTTISVGSLFSSPGMSGFYPVQPTTDQTIDLIDGVIRLLPQLNQCAALASILPMIAGLAIPAVLWQKAKK